MKSHAFALLAAISLVFATGPRVFGASLYWLIFSLDPQPLEAAQVIPPGSRRLPAVHFRQRVPPDAYLIT
jgi:hypothetical protein